MIHVFHGLLGSPRDFFFLQREGVRIYDLYTLKNYPQINEEDCLIGYSLGGRIALEIGDQIQYRCQKLVLINSHPGLESEDQKSERKDFENKVISEMKSKTKDEFLSWWNDLLIFKNDRPINTTEEIFKASLSLFEKYRLSNQKNHLHNMKKHKEKILYILGQKDETYVKLSSKLIKPSGIKVREINSGHRAFQHADELLDILLDENIL